MPNHCYNEITFIGDEERLQEIFDKHFPQDANGENAFDFNTVIPYPEEFKAQDAIAAEAREKGDWSVKDGYNAGGYDWCCNNWSTKWNAYDQNLEFNGDEFYAEFYTAWSPPENVIRKLMEMYPDVEISAAYEEAGMGFEGTFEMVNGEFIDNYIADSKRELRGG